MKAIVLIVVVFIAANCGTQQQKNLENTPNTVPSETDTLTSQLSGKWNIISIQNTTVSSDDAWLIFEKEQTLIATVGCNVHQGSYLASEPEIAFKNLISTEKYCPELDSLEQKLQKALNNIAHYKIDRNELMLLDANGVAMTLIAKN